MNKLFAVILTAAFVCSSFAATPVQDDMVSMTKKGADVTKQGTRVIYHRAKLGGKWVYVKGRRSGKIGYYKVKKGGIWVYKKVK